MLGLLDALRAAWSDRRRHVVARARWGLGAVIVVASAVAGCGNDTAPPSNAEEAMRHVHGVGVNPRDGAVILATHTGLFRLARGAQQVERIGERQQDTMGFTIVGPDRFLASGHPDLRDDLPPLLGLLESADGGRSWESRSLRGDADFHVLRPAPGRIYGYDATSQTLMRSTDDGASFQEQSGVAELLDLVVDPAAPDRVIATTTEGLIESRDGGRHWRRLPARAAGLLAWGDALYFVGAEGIVLRSRDGGRSWMSVGTLGGPPVAFSAVQDQLHAVTEGGAVRRSADGGATWQTLLTAS